MSLSRTLNGRGLYKETYASNGGNVTIGGSVKWWQSYYQGQQLLVAKILSGWAANDGNAAERVKGSDFFDELTMNGDTDTYSLDN